MNQELIVENFYNDYLKKEIDLNLSSEENALALKAIKSISYTIWCDNMITKEVLEEFLYSYNKENLITMLTNLIKIVRQEKLSKHILPRDFTSLSKNFFFYNQEIDHFGDDCELKTCFKNINVFSSGDFKIGTQKGSIDKDGVVDLYLNEESTYDEEKCYVMLSIKETFNLTNNSKTKHIFLDYYLGNNDFN